MGGKVTKEVRTKWALKRHMESPIVKCACGCGGDIRAVNIHGRKKSYISGHNGRKYDDPRQHKTEWNHRNREARYVNKMRYIRNLKAKLIIYKGGRCVKCGLEYDGENGCVYDFHHRLGKGKGKTFGLSTGNMNRFSQKILFAEADKCDLVCSNCHRLIYSAKY